MIVINDDLTSHIVKDDMTLECFLPDYNVVTLMKFTDKEQVQQFIDTMYNNPAYFSPYISPEERQIMMEQQIAAANSQQATALLQQTDWTCTVDITNPVYSNPYLMNQDQFLAYRSQVREIAVNPPVTPITDWPIRPTEVWSNSAE